jgi:putative Ca2+/H+ antiporter (TMEM165/GDT1 family)
LVSISIDGNGIAGGYMNCQLRLELHIAWDSSRQHLGQLIYAKVTDGQRITAVIYKSAEILDMDWKIFLMIFVSVFIAELGDKTQLATMLFAADKDVSKFTVFLAASAALIVASAIGVLAGSLLSEYINEKYLHYVAGIGFISIGAFTLYNA